MGLWVDLDMNKQVTYHNNGQKCEEGYYKDGKKNGLHTEWYENGQKKSEGTWKDGKEDGLHTSWYENHQGITTKILASIVGFFKIGRAHV